MLFTTKLTMMSDWVTDRIQPKDIPVEIAQKVRKAPVKPAWEGFHDVQWAALCTEDAIEAAINAMQVLDL